MQAIMEGVFDTIYLSTVILIGIRMIKKSRDNGYFKLFGYMSLLLGIGDSFHLIPRVYALFTTGLEANATSLGFGKFITSITMTIFYIILYEIWKIRFDVKDTKKLSIAVYLLGLIRIIICLFPQNDWFNYYASISWGIYRNIPFALMGIIIIYITYSKAKLNNDKDYKYMALAVLLSFLLYAPVVIWGTTYRVIGILMIPKTLAYVWIILIGYKQFSQDLKLKAGK